MAATITENEVVLDNLNSDHGKMWHIVHEDNFRLTLCGKVYPDEGNTQDFYTLDDIECVVCVDIWNRM